jgi:hypothetical protein
MQEGLMKSKKEKILILTFIFFITCTFQWARWSGLNNSDIGMWNIEADAVVHGGPEEFNFLGAYGHPGGPILEGTILARAIGIPFEYDQAIIVCISVLVGLATVAACVLCFLLRANMYWCAGVVSIVSLNWLYQFATPPSTVASAFFVVLLLVVLYLYEHRETPALQAGLLLGGSAGACIATRTDIGVFGFSIFLIFLLLVKRLSLRGAVIAIVTTTGVFVLLDPFMWFMPLEHIGDLIYKVTYHYADIAQAHVTITSLLHIATLSLMSIALCIYFLFAKRKEPLPRPFVFVLLGMSVVWVSIFLTAHSQAERYFLPILFAWEVLLPLLMLSFVDQFFSTSSFKIRHTYSVGIVLVVVLYELIFLLVDLFRFI